MCRAWLQASAAYLRCAHFHGSVLSVAKRRLVLERHRARSAATEISRRAHLVPLLIAVAENCMRMRRTKLKDDHDVAVDTKGSANIVVSGSLRKYRLVRG